MNLEQPDPMGSGREEVEEPEPKVSEIFRALARRLHGAILANDWAEVIRIRLTCEAAGYHFEQQERGA